MPAQKPEDLSPLFQSAIRSGDVEAALALYESDAVFPNAGGELRAGLEEIRQELAPLAAAKPDLSHQVKRVMKSGDLALMYSDWKMTSPFEASGQATEVARRQPDGSWRYVIDDSFTAR